MGILARLDPRHWGGRRVLQLLTGLALAALAFVAVGDVPAPSAGPARAAVVAAATPPHSLLATAPAAASPVEITPAAPAGPDATPADRDAIPAGAVQPEVGAAQAGQAASGHAGAVPAVSGAPDVVVQPTAVIGAVAPPPAGSTPASLGSRAPPLR